MDKRTLYDEFNQVEGDIQHLLVQVSDMKAFVAELLEQNVSLEIENRHLRTRLVEINGEALTDEESDKKGLSKSRLNLEMIYEEGFHVCNVCYGSRRENDEECAFCLDVIYGERK